MASWTLPNKGRPSATFSDRLLSGPCNCSKSRWWTLMFVLTRPPALGHMRLAALSIAYTLGPRTSARAQTARWWPQQSRRRPHRQLRAVRERGKPRRRKMRIRKSCGLNVVRKLVGHIVNAEPAPGPSCDLNHGFSGNGHMLEQPFTELSLDSCQSTRDAASCCHPDLIPPDS